MTSLLLAPVGEPPPAHRCGQGPSTDNSGGSETYRCNTDTWCRPRWRASAPEGPSQRRATRLDRTALEQSIVARRCRQAKCLARIASGKRSLICHEAHLPLRLALPRPRNRRERKALALAKLEAY